MFYQNNGEPEKLASDAPSLYPPSTPIETFNPLRVQVVRHVERMLSAPQAKGSRGVTFNVEGMIDGRVLSVAVTHLIASGLYELILRDRETDEIVYGETFTRDGARLTIHPIPRLLVGLIGTVDREAA